MKSAIRILFVDDEQLILSALKRTLKREGFELFFTSDPFAVGRLVAEHQIDIVVSDHMMPDMTGVEVLSLVARLHHRTMRIMMTGQADRDATIRAINEGNIHRFLEKPWVDADLKRTLHEAARTLQVQRANTRDVSTRSHMKDATGAIVIDASTLDRQ